MAKPYRLAGTPAPAPAPKQLTTPKGPVQVMDDAAEDMTLQEALRAVRVPDRPVSGAPVNVAGAGEPAAPVYPAADPWGPAGRFNDAQQMPMKLK